MDRFGRRVLLVVGKGGVGRTAITAALAVAAAKAHKRVLVAEIGEPGAAYSPLAKAFGREKLPVAPETLAPGVKGCIVWSRVGHERFLRSVLPVPGLVKAAMGSKPLLRLLSAAPSFEEMGVFYHLLTLLLDPDHDLVILDMPATGHALALASLPEILLRLMPTGPIAAALRAGQDILYDPTKTAAVVVTLPEVLPVNEALELVEGLRRTAVPVGEVLVNKVVQEDFDGEERQWVEEVLAARPLFGGARFRSLVEGQRAVGRLTSEAGVPVHVVPEVPYEGPALLQAMAQALEGRPS